MLPRLRAKPQLQEVQLTMNNDNLANVLSAIHNHEKVSKPQLATKSNSTVVTRVLDVLKQNGYIASYDVENDGKGGIINIQLTATINQCGAIKPRFAVKTTDYTKFEKRFLPAQGFGILVVSTPKGIMTHAEAKEQHLGGKLLAYCY
jgi:small subunit ribosomal protein S8